MKTTLRKRMLACYTRFVLVTIYVCRSRGSTKRVFSKAVSFLLAIFQYEIAYNAFFLHPNEHDNECARNEHDNECARNEHDNKCARCEVSLEFFHF